MRDEATSYTIETWGCQMNVHDSERLAGLLDETGLTRAASEDEADVILLNTCAVRDKAVHKVLSRLGELRRLKSRKPELVLGVVGCVAQQEGAELFDRVPWLDLVVGPRALDAVPRLLADVREGRRGIDLTHSLSRFDEPMGPVARGVPFKAWLTVMEGCNKNCSFCIVPWTRGRELYRPLEHVVEEATAAVRDGALEVELLGQNVNSWTHGEHDFADLLRAVDAVPGLKRLRFATNHPRHFSDRIIEAMAEGSNLCPYVHLPVQSGSNAVLKAMYRGYTSEDFLCRIERLRRGLPGVALSTDIIVGFPGETAQDFDQTLQLVAEVAFDQIYSFVYSPRPHTRAAALDDPVPLEVKRGWLAELQTRQREIQMARNRALVGSRLEVLAEGLSRTNRTVWTGRSPCARVVNFSAPSDPTGRLVTVALTGASPYSLSGRCEATEPA